MPCRVRRRRLSSRGPRCVANELLLRLHKPPVAALTPIAVRTRELLRLIHQLSVFNTAARRVVTETRLLNRPTAPILLLLWRREDVGPGIPGGRPTRGR